MARSKPQSFRIGHSTLIISAKGGKHTDGIVLDPWRNGGKVFWRATKADKKYIWLLESEVLKAQAKKIGTIVVTSPAQSWNAATNVRKQT